MERFDCRKCGENVFVVQGIEHLGPLPRELVCAGCGTKYTAELTPKGRLSVHQGGPRKPRAAKPKESAKPKGETPTLLKGMSVDVEKPSKGGRKEKKAGRL